MIRWTWAIRKHQLSSISSKHPAQCPPCMYGTCEGINLATTRGNIMETIQRSFATSNTRNNCRTLLTACAGAVALLCSSASMAQRSNFDVSARLVDGLEQVGWTKTLGSFGTMATVKILSVSGYTISAGDAVYVFPQKEPTHTPMVAETQSITNCSAVPQFETIAFSKSDTDTTTHSFTWGFTEGVKLTFKASIPMVGDSTVEGSFGANQSTTDTTTSGVTKTFTTSLSLTAAPMMTQYGQLVVDNGALEGTFTVPVYASGPATARIQVSVSGGPTIVDDVPVNLDTTLPQIAMRSFVIGGTVKAQSSLRASTYVSNPTPVTANDAICKSPGLAARSRSPKLLVHSVPTANARVQGRIVQAGILPLVTRRSR